PASKPLHQLSSAVRGTQDPHRGQRQAAQGLSAMGDPLRTTPRSAALRKLATPRRDVSGTGAPGGEPDGYGSCGEYATRQTKAARQFPGRTNCMRTRSLAPPVGRRSNVCISQAKTKTFLRRKNQPKSAASVCLPLVGPGALKPS